MKQALLVVALSTLAACAAATDDDGTSSDDLIGGINVTAERKITTRTLEVDIATPLIAPNAVNGPHRIRVTLPNDYDANPSARYPVIYLLHGGAGGNSAAWTTGGGAAEAITDGASVIVVMADGGKVGWYTNWINQSKGAQRWADFYLTQLIPWVDATYRTVAAKEGRAIAGLSMGGYGAVRLAQDRPDLFASVASFSGALDLGNLGTRTVITEQCIQNGFSGDGPFGKPLFPTNAAWKDEDPMQRAARLKGLQVLLYAGAGASGTDVIEGTMRSSTDAFSKALDKAGVPHTWWMYGRPSAGPYVCDGGHDFGCWNFAFHDALPRMLTVLKLP